MDRVRFGRALGQGTREAARALLDAADAATAPNPHPAQTVHRARTATTRVKHGTRRFGEALWGPVARISGVVLLEVTGVLFSLFALVSGFEVWKHRQDLHAVGSARTHLLLACAMFVTFTYFTLSSFIRAGRRDRR